jgi:hypothetical protein
MIFSFDEFQNVNISFHLSYLIQVLKQYTVCYIAFWIGLSFQPSFLCYNPVIVSVIWKRYVYTIEIRVIKRYKY